jgi:hypothetical protein
MQSVIPRLFWTQRLLCAPLYLGIISGAKPSQTDTIGQYRQIMAFAVVDLYLALRYCPGLIPVGLSTRKPRPKIRVLCTETRKIKWPDIHCPPEIGGYIRSSSWTSRVPLAVPYPVGKPRGFLYTIAAGHLGGATVWMMSVVDASNRSNVHCTIWPICDTKGSWG